MLAARLQLAWCRTATLVLRPRLIAGIDRREPMPVLKTSPLDGLHQTLGARFVPFAGWNMPLRYTMGTLAEHKACRTSAALFDVSHMGQIELCEPDAVQALQTVVPARLDALAVGQAKYSFLLNQSGGIEDDLIITRCEGGLFLVVNAARADHDLRFLRERCGLELCTLADRALIALQGPKAAEVLAQHCPDIAGLRFMQSGEFDLMSVKARISRLGYTGEDGFEIALDAPDAAAVAATLLDHDYVSAAGLGARDTLRLEAGLCLYGQDLDDRTTPFEANLDWAVNQHCLENRVFAAANALIRQRDRGVERCLVGLSSEGRSLPRPGTDILDLDGSKIGTVTSGGFAPSLEQPVAMGYTRIRHLTAGSEVQLLIRGTAVAAKIVPLPFVAHRYHRTPTTE